MDKNDFKSKENFYDKGYDKLEKRIEILYNANQNLVEEVTKRDDKILEQKKETKKIIDGWFAERVENEYWQAQYKRMMSTMENIIIGCSFIILGLLFNSRELNNDLDFNVIMIFLGCGTVILSIIFDKVKKKKIRDEVFKKISELTEETDT